MDFLKTVLYGIIEGITEWLPVSSTGHLILAEKYLNMPFDESFLELFRVVIQLGAILAVVVLYFPKLWPFCADAKKHYLKTDTWLMWFKIVVAPCRPWCWACFWTIGWRPTCITMWWLPLC